MVMMYKIVEDFLILEYKQSYNSYKVLEFEPVSELSIEVKNLENEEVQKFSEMEEFWSTYGPFSSIIVILGTLASCLSIVCCFNSFRRNLEIYEESPFNPANGSQV
uniref:Uncharacterized protein n=1 Tax=Strombidium rassoulzadegani TaxID=1082188 RepID=A0A7S3CM55_9SPIT|mmetsp:Transcript_1443/g.2526  ORF Transcript_1443/g.2526 Transcript_1443/m.2526 type:complete len:106 (+) Transcript_1443:777-1094(+)